MEDYITRFKSYLHQSGYSVGTQRMLPGCVRDFLAYAGCKAVIKVTPQIIGLFYEWLHVRPLKRKGGRTEWDDDPPLCVCLKSVF